MQKVALIIGLFLFIPLVGSLPASAQHVSPEARISLLTASPGEELYAAFGHSALWVADPVNDIDEVYNWGTFAFDTPNFYMKFLQGRLLYELSVTPMRTFLLSYHYAGRSVVEQELNLTHAEKNRIYQFLIVNRQPENIYYLYDFYYDNCATRIRDLADHELNIDWGPDPHPHQERTFRDLLGPYVGHTPWIAFGIDILLGIPSDKVAAPWHYMFLPDEMFIAFQQARHADGRPLVKSYNEILPKTVDLGEPSFFTPLWVFWVVFFLGIMTLWHKKAFDVSRMIFFFVLGLLGVVVFFMWFLSDHIATAVNLNILWALPTHIYFAFRMQHARMSKLTRAYMMIVFWLSLALLILWPLNPQDFHPAFFPLIALAALFTGADMIRKFLDHMKKRNLSRRQPAA